MEKQVRKNVKNKIKGKFTVVPNEVITNDLKDKTFRLLVLMYSKPEDWQFNQTALANELNVTTRTIRQAMEELQEKGYLTITKSNTQKGYEYTYELEIEPVPQRKNSSVGRILPLEENFLYNNTNSLTNTKKEITNITLNTKVIDNTVQEKLIEVLSVEQEEFMNRILNAFQINRYDKQIYLRNEFTKMIIFFDEEIIMNAIEILAAKNRINQINGNEPIQNELVYLLKILQNWKELNVQTLEDVIKANKLMKAKLN